MNRNGFTLVELMVTVAIIGILFALGAPLMNNVAKVSEKQKLYVKMDTSTGKTMEIIKRIVRNSKWLEMYDLVGENAIDFSIDKKITTGTVITTGGPIILSNDKDISIENKVVFNYDAENKTIYVGDQKDDIIGENISKVEYKYSQNLNILKIEITTEITDTTKGTGESGRVITRKAIDIVKSRMTTR